MLNYQEMFGIMFFSLGWSTWIPDRLCKPPSGFSVSPLLGRNLWKKLLSSFFGALEKVQLIINHPILYICRHTVDAETSCTNCSTWNVWQNWRIILGLSCFCLISKPSTVFTFSTIWHSQMSKPQHFIQDWTIVQWCVWCWDKPPKGSMILPLK